MGRLVSIRQMQLVDGCGVGASNGPGEASTAGKAPPPWTSLDGFAEGDDGRTYSWRIVTAAVLAGTDPLDDSEGSVALADLAGVTACITGGEPSLVVVDAPHFGPELLDALQYAPAWVRARVFYPLLTGAEQAWLDELEQRDADELVPRVVAALEAQLGVPLRVEADRATWAARIMLEVGYVISTDHLFSAFGPRFSIEAQELITAWLAERAPD